MQKTEPQASNLSSLQQTKCDKRTFYVPISHFRRKVLLILTCQTARWQISIPLQRKLPHPSVSWSTVIFISFFSIFLKKEMWRIHPYLKVQLAVENHKITESQIVGFGRDLWDHLVQTPCQSRVTQSRLHRTLSRQVLNISRERHSTTSLGNLFHCSVTLRGKKFFLMFRQIFLCFSLSLLPLVLSLGTTEKSLASSSWHPPLRYL